MALAERADLVARLTLDDKFSGRIAGVQSKLRGMEGSLSRIAGHANKGLRTATANLAKIGVVAGGFVALNVRAGINSLAELEDATTSVDGAIKDLGLTGRLTSQQVAGWANEIESSVQAAFDDKEITQAATTLLRFGKVAPEALRDTLVVATDLAAKTGDVGSAAEALAKSLADPTKATRVLRQVGVTLTEQEQEQIKAWVESGKLGRAQALILDKVAASTKGAAAAAKGPYNDALNTLTDVTEDAQRALGEAFLPLLQRVAKFLSGELAKPTTIAKLRDFGKDLAGGFEKAIEVGKNIPWGLIGDSLQTAGKGAKAIFDAFTMLPPWVQQAVITGWGLNKLTGGALGGIVGELGKGLIKGVLGMTAGVVNIRAGAVTGMGGVGSAAGAAATSGMAYQTGRVIGTAMKVFGVLAIAELASQLAPQINSLGAELGRKVPILLAERLALGKQIGELYWPFGSKGTPSWAGGTGVFGDSTHNRGLFPRDTPDRAPAPGTPTTRPLTGSVFTAEQTKANVKWAKIATATEKSNAKLAEQQRKIEMVRTAAERTKAAVDWSRQAIVSAGHSDANRIVSGVASAIRNLPAPIVRLSVTSTTFIRAAQVSGTYTAAHVGAYNKAGSLIG